MLDRGKTGRSGAPNDDRTARIAIAVESGSTSYPAQVTVKLLLGSDSPETLLTTLTTSTGEDESGRVVHVFHSALDLHRSFEAHTVDLRTGVGSLRLDGPMGGPSLQCAFTPADSAAQSENRAARPRTRR